MKKLIILLTLLLNLVPYYDNETGSLKFGSELYAQDPPDEIGCPDNPCECGCCGCCSCTSETGYMCQVCGGRYVVGDGDDDDDEACSCCGSASCSSPGACGACECSCCGSTSCSTPNNCSACEDDICYCCGSSFCSNPNNCSACGGGGGGGYCSCCGSSFCSNPNNCSACGGNTCSCCGSSYCSNPNNCSACGGNTCSCCGSSYCSSPNNCSACGGNTCSCCGSTSCSSPGACGACPTPCSCCGSTSCSSPGACGACPRCGCGHLYCTSSHVLACGVGHCNGICNCPRCACGHTNCSSTHIMACGQRHCDNICNCPRCACGHTNCTSTHVLACGRQHCNNVCNCPVDCNGVPNGTAVRDNCNTCVGGNTGRTACVEDCNSQWGGTAFYDECGICVGGNTTLEPCDPCEGEKCTICGKLKVSNGRDCELCTCPYTCPCCGGTDCPVDYCNIAFKPVFDGYCSVSCNCCLDYHGPICPVSGGPTIPYGAPACPCCGGACCYDPNPDICHTTGQNRFDCICPGEKCTMCGHLKISNGDANCPVCQCCPGEKCQVCGNLKVANGDENCTVCQCPLDCNSVPGGTAHLDNCNTCVGGNTGRTACVQDCNGDWGGTAIINACNECVGGTTNKENCTPCIPLTFNYGMAVTPIAEDPIYIGFGWCSFITLATMRGGDPCTYAADYYATYRAADGIIGCNSQIGMTPAHLRPFYARHGITVGAGVWSECSLVNGVNPNRGLLVTPGAHIYLIYGFHRTGGGDITMDKFDTNDAPWNQNGIPLNIEMPNAIATR